MPRITPATNQAGSDSAARQPLAIKLCGMTLPQDVDAAITAGASHIGLIMVAKSPRVLTIKEATRLSDQIARQPSPKWGSPVKRVGVFMDQPLANVQAMAQSIGLDVIQLHGSEPPTYCQTLAERWPIIKAFTITDPTADLAHVANYAPHIQIALLDRPKHCEVEVLAWHRNLALQTEGLTVPWWLAGGLTPDNVNQMLRLYHHIPGDGTRIRSNPPRGLDVASGIEQSPGIKDNAKLQAFIKHCSI